MFGQHLPGPGIFAFCSKHRSTALRCCRSTSGCRGLEHTGDRAGAAWKTCKWMRVSRLDPVAFFYLSMLRAHLVVLHSWRGPTHPFGLAQTQEIHTEGRVQTSFSSPFGHRLESNVCNNRR